MLSWSLSWNRKPSYSLTFNSLMGLWSHHPSIYSSFTPLFRSSLESPKHTVQSPQRISACALFLFKKSAWDRERKSSALARAPLCVTPSASWAQLKQKDLSYNFFLLLAGSASRGAASFSSSCVGRLESCVFRRGSSGDDDDGDGGARNHSRTHPLAGGGGGAHPQEVEGGGGVGKRA